MSNILVLYGSQPCDFAPVDLNATLAERARRWLGDEGDAVRLTTVAEGCDVESEGANHRCADTVILAEVSDVAA